MARRRRQQRRPLLLCRPRFRRLLSPHRIGAWHGQSKTPKRRSLRARSLDDHLFNGPFKLTPREGFRFLRVDWKLTALAGDSAAISELAAILKLSVSQQSNIPSGSYRLFDMDKVTLRNASTPQPARTVWTIAPDAANIIAPNGLFAGGRDQPGWHFSEQTYAGKLKINRFVGLLDVGHRVEISGLFAVPKSWRLVDSALKVYDESPISIQGQP